MFTQHLSSQGPLRGQRAPVPGIQGLAPPATCSLACPPSWAGLPSSGPKACGTLRVSPGQGEHGDSPAAYMCSLQPPVTWHRDGSAGNTVVRLSLSGKHGLWAHCWTPRLCGATGPQCTRPRPQDVAERSGQTAASVRPSTVCLEGDGGHRGAVGLPAPGQSDEEAEALGGLSSCSPTSTFQEEPA